MKRVKKIIISIIIIWIIMFGIDFFKVKSFEKPVFCVLQPEFQDGGSGNFIGLGYSFYIKSNFMPFDELKVITEYKMKLFGVNIKNGIRD